MSNTFGSLRCHTYAVPMIPVGHPDYVWRGAADVDVQRTWRLYGWKPTRELAAQAKFRATAQAVRQVRKAG